MRVRDALPSFPALPSECVRDTLAQQTLGLGRAAGLSQRRRFRLHPVLPRFGAALGWASPAGTVPSVTGTSSSVRCLSSFSSTAFSKILPQPTNVQLFHWNQRTIPGFFLFQRAGTDLLPEGKKWSSTKTFRTINARTRRTENLPGYTNRANPNHFPFGCQVCAAFKNTPRTGLCH